MTDPDPNERLEVWLWLLAIASMIFGAGLMGAMIESVVSQ